MIVSSHAVERYQERVRPGLDLAGARRELETLVPFGRLSNERPPWKVAGEHAETWLYLGPDVALPLRSGVLSTCIFRTPNPDVVAGRRKRKRFRVRADTTPDRVRRELRERATAPETEDVA